MSKFAQSISVEQKRFNPTPNLQRRRPKPDVTAATSTVAAARTSSTAATSTAAAMYQTPDAFTPAAVISTSAATTTTAVFAPANVTPHLPKGWNKVIEERDRQWISRCLYESKNVARRSSELRMWYDPPHPKLSLNFIPRNLLQSFYHKKLCLWAPYRLWSYLFSCMECGTRLRCGGFYNHARLVLDISS